MERKAKAATQSWIYLGLLAAILVVINLISYGLQRRIDLTKSERFTLSKGSARLVREGLKQDLTIELYVTRGLPKHDAFVRDLVDLMNEYQQAAHGKLKYVLIEPKTDEQRQAAKDAGLQEAAFGEGSETGDQATITRGYMGMVFKYGSEKDTIPILSPEQNQGLEFWVTNKIREIRDRGDDLEQKVGVISSKEGFKLSENSLVPPQGGRQGPSMQSILQQALPFYKFEDVDLQDGNTEIDKKLVGLIVLQADKDFGEKELRRIDQFLMLGNKSLAVIAGAVNMKLNDASMKASLDTHGLEKLLGGYGIEMKNEAVLDWGRSVAIPVRTESGRPVWFRAPAIVHAQYDDRLEQNEQLLDNSFNGFFRLEELSFPFPSTLVPHPEKQPEAVIKVVARSTPRSTVDNSESMDMKLRTDWQPKGEYGQRAMAVVLEGKIKSAYAGAEDKEIKPANKAAAGSRILVISAAQFLANPFARAGNPPPLPPQMAMMGSFGGDQDLQAMAWPYAQQYLTGTILAFKNILDWMAGDADLIGVSAKLLGDPNLTYSDIAKPKEEPTDDEQVRAKNAESYRLERQNVQRKVQWTVTLFPPLLFAVFGLVRWRRRESRRGAVRLD
ncbi:MAG: GldG family protein [Deltaproteobacteria bacterium]|nr:GldG family protein [Deltaproteobacteria bacterium]